MKTEMLYDKLSERWVPAPVESLLVDKPLGGPMGNSLHGSFDGHIQETADSYTLEVAVPGMNKKDLRLEAADGVLTIYGHKQQKDISGWARRTIALKSTQIIRTIVLPEEADSDSIKAKCRDGLLKISMPKEKNRQHSWRFLLRKQEKGTGGI